MLSRKVLSTGIVSSATKSIRLQQQTCAFTNSAIHQEQQDSTPAKTPYRSARYLLELTERQKRQSSFGERKPRREGSQASTDRRSNKGSYKNDREGPSPRTPASRFKPQPVIPYETTKNLQFPDEIDWEVSSVTDSRPLYVNVAVGRGGIAPLGTAAISNPTYNTNGPATAYSAHITGVRVNGDLDPEVEQSLIQEVAPIQGNKDKDHRKKSDVSSIEHQPVLFRLTHNYQEIMNPLNAINQFNNGNVKHVAGIKYEIGSDESKGANDKQEEKSWKRLERLGGDYSRPTNPLSQLSGTKTGSEGTPILKNISNLMGQNQSIGLEDKKKFLRAVEKGLGNI